MGDDGAGTYVVSLIINENLRAECVTLITPGYDLITYLQGREKAIIVDAAQFGGKPGEVRRIERSEIIPKKKSSGFSLHDSDIFKIIDYAEKLKIAPKDVSVYCIQQLRVEPGEELSPEVKTGAIRAANLITQEIIRESIIV